MRVGALNMVDEMQKEIEKRKKERGGKQKDIYREKNTSFLKANIQFLTRANK